MVDNFLVFLEQTALGTFIRESSSLLAFPTVLFLHTLGLSLLVGINGVVAFRVLGVGSSIPMKPLARLYPFMWIGFVITVLSGLGLAIAAATTRMLNPILLVKLVMVAAATIIMRRMELKIFRNPNSADGDGKGMAAALLVLWLAVTTAGRLIAYSATIFGHTR